LEGRGQELPDSVLPDFVGCGAVGDQHECVGGVLGEELSARAAWCGAAIDPGGHGDGCELAMSLGEGLEEGNPFRAAGQAVAGALDVGAPHYATGAGLNGGADGESGVGRDGLSPGGKRLADET